MMYNIKNAHEQLLIEYGYQKGLADAYRKVFEKLEIIEKPKPIPNINSRG